MKTSHSIIRIFGLGSLLALALNFSAAQLHAGPGIDYWRRTVPIETVKQAEELPLGSTMMMVCGACKTVSITDYKADLPNGRGPQHWVELGSKHECEHCGGTITVVQGKTKDEMQHNCSKCGEGAAFCCAVTPDAGKK